jgi:hypothetical protein
MNRSATVLRRGVAVAVIAFGPLTDLRAQCGVALSPGQLAALVESLQ